MMHDSRLSANRAVGLLVKGDDTLCTAARLLIDGTLAQQSNGRFGRGVEADSGGTIEIQTSRLVGNREAGLFAVEASLRVVGITVDDTYLSDLAHDSGNGMWLAGNPTASLSAVALRSNRGEGLGVYKSEIQARGLVVLATQWSTSELIDAKRKTIGTATQADGILLNTSPNSTIDQCLIAANERTGILVESSAGVKITHTLVNGGKGLYGLVFQHTLDAIDQFNAVFGASLQDRAKDAGLSLPAPPEPVQALSLAP